MISDRPDLLVVGEVGKPHGLRGEVYVVVISDDPSRFAPGSELIGRDGQVLVVAEARPHNQRLLVTFSGVESREKAAELKGPLYVPGDRVRDLSGDEFWPHDLTGCEAVDVTGKRLGVVTRVIERPPQDLLEISTDRGPRAVPFVGSIVVGVDVAVKRVVIDPPEGLLD